MFGPYINHEAVVFDDITVCRGNFLLCRLYFFADELGDFSRFYANHVVMVLSGVELIIGLATFEIVFRNQSSGFELIQHTVNRRQPDFFPGLHQAPVDIVCRQMPVSLGFQYFENPFARMRNFQPGLF